MKKIVKLGILALVAFMAVGLFQARGASGHEESREDTGRLGALAGTVVAWVADAVHHVSDGRLGYERHHTGHEVAHQERSDGDFDWSGRLSEGDVVEIRGVNGPIVAEAAEGREVRVEARKRGRRSDPAEVRIEVVEHRDGVTVCAVYPGRGNSCEPDGRGGNNVEDNDVQVSFHVWVPAGVTFVGRTVNGDVEVVDLDAAVDVATVNGGLDIDTRGTVEARTVNGSIRAAMGERDWRGTLEFATVNGSITLDVPDDLDADVEASWLNGGLDTDLPFTVQGRQSRQQARGQLGRGGPAIELETVNGSIRIR